MKFMIITASVVAAIAIAATGAVTVQAQAPQSGPPAAATQNPTNVNVVNVPTVTIGNTELQPIAVKGPVKEPVHASFNTTIPFSIGLATVRRPCHK